MGLGDSPEMAAKPPGTCASGSCHHLRLKRCSRERCQPELPRREHGQELRSWGEGAGEETPPPAPPALQAAPLTLSRNQGAQEPVGSAPKAQRTGTGGEAEITSLAHQMRTGRGPKVLGVTSCVAFSLPSALRAPFWGSDFRSDTSDTCGFSCPGGLFPSHRVPESHVLGAGSLPLRVSDPSVRVPHAYRQSKVRRARFLAVFLV